MSKKKHYLKIEFDETSFRFNCSLNPVQEMIALIALIKQMVAHSEDDAEVYKSFLGASIAKIHELETMAKEELEKTEE